MMRKRTRSLPRRALKGALLGLVVLAVLPSVAFAEAPEAPAMEPATAITGTSATLNGELNPGASVEKVSYRFFYSPGGECTSFLAVPAEPPFPEAEGSHQKVSAPVTGLEALTTYQVCLLASNPANEAEATFSLAPDVFETAASKPVVISETAAGVTPFAASLQAEVNPENQPTTSCVFEYGKAALGENKLPCEQLEFTGGAPGTATRTLAGLSPHTKYKFRVVVKNATGETKGTEQSFETLAVETPSVTSESVSSIQPFQARLEGILNPNFQPTKCKFSYGLAVGEHETPCEPELFEGFGEQGFGANVTGLEAGTTYHYEVLARNAAGETTGSEQEFTTPALEAPVFGAESSSGITSTDAQLEARINPDAQETSVTFEYSTEQSAVEEGKGTPVSAAALPAAFEEVTAGPVDLGGNLAPGTTYFYRVIATNPKGETAGPVEQFTTSPAEPPIILGESASNVTETGADLEATINPNSHEATYSFEYSTEESAVQKGEGTTVKGKTPLPAVNEELPAGPIHLAGLQAATVYYYRIIAVNPVMGTVDGAVQSFHTLGKPAITTEPEATTRTTATINATINPNGSPTLYSILYIAECTEESTLCPEEESIGIRTIPTSSYTPQPAGPVTLQELKPGTTYFYIVIATNQAGTTISEEQEFTTSPRTPPTATLNPATSITPTTATITATIDTRGLPTTISLQVGTEPANTTPINATTTQENNTIHATAILQGLQPNTTYTITLTATNPDGTTTPTTTTFTTPPNPALLTTPPTSPTLTYTPITTITTQQNKEDKQNIQRELLNKALKTCRHKPKHQRKHCERQARKRYGKRTS